jgi:hypothetical protein
VEEDNGGGPSPGYQFDLGRPILHESLEPSVASWNVEGH